MRTALCFLLLFLLLCGRSGAQEFPMRNYTTQDGLAHDNVFRMLQDRRGFLCFATNYGLSVYDGRRFRNYTSRDGLSNNCIISLTEDGEGNKILSTYGGGVCLLSADGKLSTLRPRQGKLPANVIYAASFRNSIWIIGLDTVGYRLFRFEGARAQKMAVLDDTGREVIFTKGIQTGSGLLFATNHGIYRLDSSLRPVPFPAGIISGEVADIRPGFNQDYWAATGEGLVHFNEKGRLASLPFSGTKRISSLLPQSGGGVLVATVGDGLFLVQDGAVNRLSASLHLPHIILNDVLQDAEGNIWVATHGEGVYRLNALDVLHYAPQAGRMNVYCRAITPLPDGGLLVGSVGTISIWKNDTLRPLPLMNLAAADFVYFLAAAEEGFYFGSPHGMFRKSLRAPYAEKPVLCRGGRMGAISFFRDENGRQWVGGFAGLFQLLGDSLVPANDGRTRGRRINAIAGDGRGRLLLGTDAGTELYDPGTGRFSSLALPLPARVNGILRDDRDRIWMASSEGLLCLSGDSFHRYTVDEGLLHNGCDVLAVSGNTLLIGTVNGLCYLDLNTLKIGGGEGSFYPNQVLSLFVAGNRIFAGLVNGMSVLLRQAPEKPLAPPPLYLTAIKSGTQDLPADGGVELSYKDNKLSVEFIGISFRNAERVQYRYRIVGLDNRWHITGNNAIELTALPSGEYILVLNARLGTGNWGPDLRLPVHVRTPFWRSWWFLLLSVALAGGLLFLGIRFFITRREKRKRERLSVYYKVAYLKQQALSALINPHFIFNCMNSIQHFLNRNDRDKANEYLADFAQLIRMTMEQSQEAFISIANEVARLRLYLSLEQLRFGDELRYDISIDPALDTGATLLPNMMLQPYVENALWHGIMPKKSPGRIQIAFEKQDGETLRISVTDDGKGLAVPGGEGGGARKAYGRLLTEERLALLSRLLEQRCSVSAAPASPGSRWPGLRVEITLPLHLRQDRLKAVEAEVAKGE